MDGQRQGVMCDVQDELQGEAVARLSDFILHVCWEMVDLEYLHDLRQAAARQELLAELTLLIGRHVNRHHSRAQYLQMVSH